MTDRIYALSVILDREYRVDDVEAIINAIKMIKGVAGVQTHVADMETSFAVTQAKLELQEKLLQLLDNFDVALAHCQAKLELREKLLQLYKDYTG